MENGGGVDDRNNESWERLYLRVPLLCSMYHVLIFAMMVLGDYLKFERNGKRE